LEAAHREHGKLPWAALFEPAIRLAEQGFPVSPRLHSLLAADTHLKQNPAAAAFYYQADGTPLPVGQRLRNPALAQLLRNIAEHGASVFYEGVVAHAVIEQVNRHANPGRLSLADFTGYRAKKREP